MLPWVSNCQYSDKFILLYCRYLHEIIKTYAGYFSERLTTKGKKWVIEERNKQVRYEEVNILSLRLFRYAFNHIGSRYLPPSFDNKTLSLSLNRLGLWRLMYHSWHKLHFYKKNQTLQNVFLISVMLRRHRASVACKNQS